MLNVIAEMLKAKFEIGEMANLFSGSFTRTLERAIRQ
jgi:hypothetical protein